ncbi:MAG: glutamate--tRNA ligase [Alphaproteobacteria bacterium]
MTVVTRFAPSPTGRLHVGNARVALVNWLFARNNGGRFILRLDDTDAERSTAEYAAAIEDDLAWLGLEYDERHRQSERRDRYAAAFDGLVAAGRVYACYESAEELAEKRRRQQARNRPPVYDRAALGLSDADRKALEAEGRQPHWRFRLDDGAVVWDDLAQGAKRFPSNSFSDPVILRADRRPTYTLASVVDDAELGVNHVIRGEDHVANTAVQIQIFAALGAALPAFAHLPLLTDAEGRNLSKRAGSLSLGALRARGIEPMALNSLLARLGTADPVAPRIALGDLIDGFDLGRFGRAAPRFDEAELERLNARVLHLMPFAAVAERLAAMDLAAADETFWNAVRPNLARIDDAKTWWRVCHGAIRPVIDDPAVTARAAELLPAGAWDGATWKLWTEAVSRATGRRGKALFRPLRLALTGREHGPELKNLLPIIGRARAEARLRGETA